jgi:hypothetical protein
MKHVKSVFAVAALVAFSSPAAVLAADGEDGLKACVSALVQDLSEAQDYPMQATISEDSFVAEERLGRRTRIHLDVRDPVSREIVVKADCIVNRHAEVVRLERLPDEAPEAEIRSL